MSCSDGDEIDIYMSEQLCMAVYMTFDYVSALMEYPGCLPEQIFVVNCHCLLYL